MTSPVVPATVSSPPSVEIVVAVPAGTRDGGVQRAVAAREVAVVPEGHAAPDALRFVNVGRIRL